MKFRKKAITIDAMHFANNNESADVTMNALVIWINQSLGPTDPHAWHDGTSIFIPTLEGTMTAGIGDWIVCGIKGEFYPVKADVFAATYEAVP